jgi:hypothetical protein
MGRRCIVWQQGRLYWAVPCDANRDFPVYALRPFDSDVSVPNSTATVDSDVDANDRRHHVTNDKRTPPALKWIAEAYETFVAELAAQPRGQSSATAKKFRNFLIGHWPPTKIDLED